MYFNRFDICEAYYLYMMLHHNGQWSKEYAMSGTFHKLRFRPAPSLSDRDDLEENGQVIYDALVSGEREIRDRR